MKVFTIAEANDILPKVIPKIEAIKRLYEKIQLDSNAARQAASASEFGGGMQGGTRYVKSLYEVGKLTTELANMGVEVKDYTRGLIDFPSLRDGRIVFLCWQLGEGDSIGWWHEIEAGFAGRQPL